MPSVANDKMHPDYWYVDGVAYDFTGFVKNHPGGKWALNLGKGRECRPMMESYHMHEPPAKLFAKYRLNDEDQKKYGVSKTFAPAVKFTYKQDGFLNTVKREVNAYFKENKMSYKAPWTHVLMFYANVTLLLYTCFLALSQGSVAWAVVHGILRALLVVQTTHGASHFAFSKNPTANRWAYRLGTMLIGLWSPATWDVQHVVAHHVYTSEWPYDSDSAFPLKSILYNQRRFWYHKYQHVYMWIVYSFTIPLVMFNSIKDVILQKQVTFRIRYHSLADKIEAYGCSGFAVLYVYLPFLVLPFWTALLVFMVSNVTSSLYFSLQFVVNHEVDCLIPDKPFKPEVDWGEYQMETSLTFAPKSRLSLEAAGGLNTQIEHHLFPGVHYSHYNEVGAIIRKVAKEMGLQYTYRDTLWEALQAHYRLLKNPPASVRVKDEKAKKTAKKVQ
eukprot:TRINITY_DN888_c0_g2_i1.p1 TRINITY_DN888_c0_g2~~TRINITY_DN888_c0_g2_i1.p1  ORF type:complete len:443 (+),score=127.43 TRINITY_DN888_c0_g2_i1:308-1636(+)